MFFLKIILWLKENPKVVAVLALAALEALIVWKSYNHGRDVERAANLAAALNKTTTLEKTYDEIDLTVPDAAGVLDLLQRRGAF